MKNFINRALVAKKNLKLFFALFAMLALGVGNAWADVNCDFTTKSASHGTYTDSWDYGDFIVFGGANNNKTWAYVKMGGKQTNLATANPVYISSPKMTSAISKVQVSIIAGSLSKTGMSVNSWGVYVYSDANMTNQVDYVKGGTITKDAAVFEFTPTTGTTWSENNYYKVSFDLKNTTTTNGIILVDKVTFVESTDDGGETPDPTPDPEPDPTPDPEEPETPGIDGESSTATFTYKDLQGQGASSTGAEFTGATKDPIFMSGKGYCKSTNSYVQIYANNYLTFTPTNATITRIVLTATSDYIKTWKASEGTIEVSGDKATWTGSSTSVVTLTNTASAQARITQMDVTYTISGGGSTQPVDSLTAK